MIKKLLVLIIFITSLTAYCQTATYGSISKKGSYDRYITKDRDTIKVGSTLYIGEPRTDVYTYITQGNQPASAILSDTSIEIEKIKTVGNKKRGYKTFIGFSGYGLLTVWIDYESALKSGEIL